jgi:predicted nucleotidyltransferase
MSERHLTIDDWQRLADCLACGGNVMAGWAFGSARKGVVRPGADIDIGIYFARMPSIDELTDLRSAIQDALSFDEIDLVVLNEASPILRFEAVSGRPVYTADRQSRATFVSLTAREYEDEMAQWKRALNWGG